MVIHQLEKTPGDAGDPTSQGGAGPSSPATPPKTEKLEEMLSRVELTSTTQGKSQHVQGTPAQGSIVLDDVEPMETGNPEQPVDAFANFESRIWREGSRYVPGSLSESG